MKNNARHALLALLAATTSLGCGGLEADPVTLIKATRLIAIEASPPFIAGPGLPGIPPGTQTKLTPLLVGRKPLGKYCYAWRLCPFAWSKDGNYRCASPKIEVDLGTNPTAVVSALDVLESVSRFSEVAEDLGLVGPTSGDQSGGDVATQQQNSTAGLEVTVLFMFGDAGLWGGTCPTDSTTMLGDVCPSRSGCVAGYTKLAFATKPLQANTAPVIDALELDGVAWPAGVTPVLAPDDDSEGASPLDDDRNTRGYEVHVQFGADQVQVIKPDMDKTKEVTENLTFSWFSTNGRFRYSKTTNLFPKNRFSPSAPGEDNEDEASMTTLPATLWLVARDNRNGVTWHSRQVVIDPSASKDQHPLCALEPTLSGCDKVKQ